MTLSLMGLLLDVLGVYGFPTRDSRADHTLKNAETELRSLSTNKKDLREELLALVQESMTGW